MEIKGKVKVVGEEVQVSPTFTRRELVVTTDEQYPQSILIEFVQGKCNNDLDQLKVGEEVTVSINLSGREWINPQGEAKYFNSIKGWRVVSNMGTYTANAPQQSAQQQPPVTNANPTQVQNDNEVEDDGLPF